MVSSRSVCAAALALLLVAVGRSQTTISWANTSTDVSLLTNWTGVPGNATSLDGTLALSFDSTPTIQPIMTGNVAALGVTISAAAGNFSLTGIGTLNVGSNGFENDATGPQQIDVDLGFNTTAPTLKNYGTLTINGKVLNNATPLGMTITNNGTLTLAGGVANSGAMGLYLTGNGTAMGTVSGVISGAQPITIQSGLWTFSAANTQTGSLTLSGGALKIGTDSNLGAVPSSATAGALTINGGTLETTATMVLDANRGITAGSNGATLEVDAGTTLTYGGVITGAGSLSKAGAGTLALSGSNTLSGETIVSGGELKDLAANSFSPNSVLSLVGNSTVTVNYDESIAGLSGWASSSATSLALTGTLTINNNGTGSGYYGAISGSGSLVYSLNGGSAVLAGSSTYTGATSVNNGTLILENSTGSATGTGTVNVASNAQLQLGNGGPGGYSASDIANDGKVIFSSTDTTFAYGGTISGSGSVIVGTSSTSGTTFSLTGVNTYSGGTYVNDGTLRIGTSNALPTGTYLQLASGTTLDVTAMQTLKSIGSNNGANIVIGSESSFTLAPVTGQYGGTLDATISGTGAFVFAGASGTSTVVEGNNSYSGGTSINSGTVYIVGNSALGTGAVTLQSGSTLAVAKYSTASSTLSNSFVLSDNVTLGDGNDDALLIAGNVALASGASTLHVGQYAGFLGNVSAASSAQLTVDSASGTYGHLIIGGTIDPSVTSITASQAGVIFAAASSVPAPGVLTVKGTNAYVGLAASTGPAPAAAAVLSVIDPGNFTGVLGFDTLADHVTPTVFSDPVDVSAFGSNLTLGSSTGAVLSGTITPSSAGYLFGNGGGALVVNSALTGAYNLTVDSTTSVPNNDLVVVLHGNNSFGGSVTVNNSELVLDSGGALPTGTKVSLGADGYLGYTEAFTSAANFNDFVSQRLAAGGYTSSSVLGVDSDAFIAAFLATGDGSGSRTLSDTIDLRGLGPIALGTITRATLTGTIYAPDQSGANLTLKLLGLNEGQLTISSNLAAGQVNSVNIGSGSLSRADGVVTLSGKNTYGGGTTLKSGYTVVSGYSGTAPNGVAYGPLGTGTVTVSGGADSVTLAGSGTYAFVNNAISLGRRLLLGFASGDGNPAPRGLTAGMLTLSGVISDLSGSPGSLSIYSNTSLANANTFTGGVELHAGTLNLGTDTSLGTGTFTFDPGTDTTSSYVSVYSTGARTIANSLVYAGAPKDSVYFSGGPFTFTGSLALNQDAQFASWSAPLYFSGPITGNGRFYGVGTQPIYLSGSNTLTGGVESTLGAIVFGNAGALPASPGSNTLIADGAGYIGIGYVPANLQSDFIDRFNKGQTYGAIGFDSASRSSPNTFSGTIDLTSFASTARLGSTTAAILTGTITPQGSYYQFGNGGGTLEVASALSNGTSTRSVWISSGSGEPLTVRLTGSNTFTGGAIVSGSALVFGAGALPASGTLTASSGSNPSYIGTEDSSAFAATPNNFVNRFAASGSNFLVGFDKFTVTGDIDLTHFTSGTDPQVAVGTTSTATLSGNVLLPTAQADYRFAGYKGGQLTVGSTLTGAHGVVIGVSGATEAIPGNATSQISAVTLTAANNYTGNTTLAGGELWVGNDSALSTGALVVGSSTPDAALYTFGGTRTLTNALSVNSTLKVGGANDLALTGAISGSGELAKMGSGLLTLSGTNTWTGGLDVSDGTVTFTTGTSVGSGTISLSSDTARVNFNDSATVTGLWSGYTGSMIGIGSGKTLTINELKDTGFAGSITGSTAGLVVTGGKELELSGANTFSGSVTIQGNSVLLANSATALGASTNPVTINSGTLAVGSGITVANPITLTSGALAGTGTIKAALGSSGFNIGTGANLSPGIQGTGTLAFDGSLISTSVLILNSGGTYVWELRDGADASTGWDKITVNGTVNIAATSASPFNFSLRSVGPDGASALAANFDPTQAYSWTLLSATSITGFTGANQFALDTSSFLNANGGQFSLGLSGNSLVLNFSPVPEPSTYLLMLAGLGVTALAARRRRRG